MHMAWAPMGLIPYGRASRDSEVKPNIRETHESAFNPLPAQHHPTATLMPCENSLDLDKMPSYSASHPNPSCLTLNEHFLHLMINQIC